MKFNKSLLWISLLTIVGVGGRLIDHAPNFSPLLAIALFAGFVLSGPVALVVPVAIAFLGDAFLGFHDLMWIVYLCMLGFSFMGRHLPEAEGKPLKYIRWGFYGLTASSVFFVVSNFAVWATSTLYPHTYQGLVDCYILAIPFFHNSLASTWMFLAAFEAARRLSPAWVPAVSSSKTVI